MKPFLHLSLYISLLVFLFTLPAQAAPARGGFTPPRTDEEKIALFERIAKDPNEHIAVAALTALTKLLLQKDPQRLQAILVRQLHSNLQNAFHPDEVKHESKKAALAAANNYEFKYVAQVVLYQMPEWSPALERTMKQVHSTFPEKPHQNLAVILNQMIITNPPTTEALVKNAKASLSASFNWLSRSLKMTGLEPENDVTDQVREPIQLNTLLALSTGIESALALNLSTESLDAFIGRVKQDMTADPSRYHFGSEESANSQALRLQKNIDTYLQKNTCSGVLSDSMPAESAHAK